MSRKAPPPTPPHCDGEGSRLFSSPLSIAMGRGRGWGLLLRDNVHHTSRGRGSEGVAVCLWIAGWASKPVRSTPARWSTRMAAANPDPPRIKGPLVWLDMDQWELDDAYDHTRYAPNRE